MTTANATRRFHTGETAAAGPGRFCASHARKVAADARRDRKLARLGWRVLRLDAELVVKKPEVALGLVREALG
ncbi:MAG: DUF559 domain-containing protein [Myxococcales bacterium]|nr:DUF559 domain-containing protein [Myxococcales bacterium]